MWSRGRRRETIHPSTFSTTQWQLMCRRQSPGHNAGQDDRQKMQNDPLEEDWLH